LPELFFKASRKNLQTREMIDQDKSIEPGNRIHVHSGRHAGETGTVIDVMWYSDQSDMYALVRVMSDGGISHFFDMRMLEKVKGHPDNDPPSGGGELTWKHVK
jgi:hypothetical protein